MTTSAQAEKAFRAELLPHWRSLVEPSGFKLRVSRHDFVRRNSGRTEVLRLLRSCYTGRPYDYIVDYGIEIEDPSIEAVLRRWGADHHLDWLGFHDAGSGLHHDVVSSADLSHTLTNPDQAKRVVGRVLLHLVSLLDHVQRDGYFTVFGPRGVAIDYYPFMAADCVQRGKRAEARRLLEALPRDLASLRLRALEDATP